MPGKIYLVATPIGNLSDITFRAIETLKEVDFIAAEDTRQTLKLLNHFNIKKPLLSYHEHNKKESGEKIINEVLEGKSAAVVTDAGTPGVSDPGSDLVKLCIQNGIEVYSIPGAAAFLYALIVSGIDTSKFVFEGFLPKKTGERKLRYEKLKDEDRTIIFYESPHRIKKTLDEFVEVFGDRPCAICRELTKIHEEVLRVTLKEAVEIYKEREPKGEFVIVLCGKSKEEMVKEKQESFEEITIEEHIKKYMKEGLTKKEAVKKVSEDRAIPKSEVYKYSIDI
ncbi:MAG TPA: 16S rRNA (cytidine(1402)-2'-O)-methyltransferase [Clostridiaceae bacterium]|nr:16S rRNA (cytidine(1402)-2'-O)-methyltransferase [Clostridiaceae bacterium]HBG39213.1 16S rRNA (cytidine(1402)-2'-O)-methyltransferase [Clostridiaceae bacterium]